jgi:ATP-dependent protease ClpP protease subunit
LSIDSLETDDLRKIVHSCASTRSIDISYSGIIDGSLAFLLEQLSAMSDAELISVRVLTIDSPGGDVESALRAGQAMANKSWRVDVPLDAQCYSACVLILAAGRNRNVLGSVGIHRMFPMRSKAETRGDLAKELQAGSDRVKTFLAEQGVNPSLVDEMMTIPSNDVRELSWLEQDRYGLGRLNVAQIDLDRTKLMRKCGEGFLRRLDAYVAAYGAICANGSITRSREADKRCRNALRARYGFPDAACPNDGPFSPEDSGDTAYIPMTATGEVDWDALGREVGLPPPRARISTLQSP